MIKINNKDRKELLKEMDRIEFKINSLKSIFQNEILINPDALEKFIEKREYINNRLNEVQYRLTTQVKVKELYQKNF